MKKKSDAKWRKLNFGFVRLFGGTSFGFPSIEAPADFNPQEVVLVLWQIDGGGNPTVLTTVDNSRAAPGVYSMSTLGELQNPLSFACAASQGALPVKRSLPPYATGDMTNVDFAIQNDCYVVLLMTNTLSDCEFQYGQPAISTVIAQTAESPKYFNLVHAVPMGSANCNPVYGKNGQENCTAAYFSAQPSDEPSSDAVNYNFQFYPYGSIEWQPKNFDPAIKNTGHIHVKIRRFVVPGSRGRSSKKTTTVAFVKTIIER